MLIPYILLPILPLLPFTLGTPRPASSLLKRDDCNGSQMCGVSSHSATTALETYASPANGPTYYHDYTSYTASKFTAIYVCPGGKYPANVTGTQIYQAGLLIKDKCGSKCGTHWLSDSDGQLKCRVTLNYCSRCKNVVNGRSGDGSGSPAPVAAPAASTSTAQAVVLDQPDIHA
ncbi:hypothetical protein MMC27_008655 [Xylographa pallens]|nr:hypothetical protein [Xylographa pallens]